MRRSRSSRAQAERGRGASRSACRGQSEQEPSTGRRLIFPRWSGKVQGEEKEAGGWRGREDLEQERLRGWEQGEAREHGRFFSSFVTELEALILSNRTALHSPGDPLSSKISIRDHGTRRPQGPGSHFQPLFSSTRSPSTTLPADTSSTPTPPRPHAPPPTAAAATAREHSARGHPTTHVVASVTHRPSLHPESSTPHQANTDHVHRPPLGPAATAAAAPPHQLCPVRLRLQIAHRVLPALSALSAFLLPPPILPPSAPLRPSPRLVLHQSRPVDARV